MLIRGAYVTREVISTNVEQYNYNGINGSDIISIKNSLFDQTEHKSTDNLLVYSQEKGMI